MTTLDKALIGQYGVYRVAAHLCWMGYNAVPTLRNTKAVDLIVHNPKTDKAIGVQVKTMRQNVKNCRKDFYAVVNAVPAEMEKVENKICNPFVFVYIPESQGYENPVPRYFVIPKMTAFRLCKDQWENYVKDSKHGEPIENIAKRKQPLSITIGQLESYENKWKNLELE